MVIAMLAVFGLAFGSFINALVWRLKEQESLVASHKSQARNKNKAIKARDLSILRGRSMCPHCRHTLSAVDLIPVVSWLLLRGMCRYCGKPISWQYPVVELFTAALFVASYVFWPTGLSHSADIARFFVWLVLLIVLIAMAVYDFKWYILPDKLNYIALGLVTAWTVANAAVFGGGAEVIRDAVLGVAAGGGLFYVLFQLSNGKWIGGGDVKLGFMFGMLLGPVKALLAIYAACLVGTAAALSLLAARRLKKSHVIPFGPFLIAGTIVAQLRGDAVISLFKSFMGI